MERTQEQLAEDVKLVIRIGLRFEEQNKLMEALSQNKRVRKEKEDSGSSENGSV